MRAAERSDAEITDVCWLRTKKRLVIYFDGEEKLVFSSVCSVVQPTVQLSNRIQPMSILEKSGDSYSVIYDKKTIELEDFFFFDGKDTHLLDTEMTAIFRY